MVVKGTGQTFFHQLSLLACLQEMGVYLGVETGSFGRIC